MLGVRADITPQVARIDAHLLNREGVTRLCYCGQRAARAARGPGAARASRCRSAPSSTAMPASRATSRSSADAAMRCARPGSPTCTSTSATWAVPRARDSRRHAATSMESELFQALQAQGRAGAARAGRRAATARCAMRCWLLPELYGGVAVLDEARARLPAWPEVTACLDAVARDRRAARDARRHVALDLAELRGYHYHSGVVFAAYAAGVPNAIALGGRYDEVGKAFGRARPATGFSMDLRELAALATARYGARCDAGAVVRRIAALARGGRPAACGRRGGDRGPAGACRPRARSWAASGCWSSATAAGRCGRSAAEADGDESNNG